MAPRAQQIDGATRLVIIDPSGQGVRASINEAWRCRVLAGFLVWRDVKVRYKQSAIGVGWAIVQPVSLTLVFALFLGRYAKVPSGGEDYWLLALSGVVPFSYFSQATSGAANALVDNVALVSKVFFPRLLLPVAGAASTLLDACLATLVLIVAAIANGSAAATAPLALFLPALILLAALAFGVWFAALNVRYRDVKAAMPLLLQLWLFATPVAYPLSLVPERLHLAYALNPMVGLVELERWLIFGEGALWTLAPGGLTCCGAMLVGIRFYLRSARWFADII